MESAIDIRTASPSSHLRAYVAGGGATAALVTAAVIVFLAVAAFVSFNGLPFGAEDSPDATVGLAAGAPQAAAAAAAPTADAVASEPATPSSVALAEIVAALPPGAIPPGLVPTETNPDFDGTGPTPPGTPGEPVPTSGAVGNTVGGLEQTAGDLGLNLPLSDLTQGLTDPIDKTLHEALNGLGGALGDEQLGDKLIGSLKETTNGLLGPGGLTDSLLGQK